MTTDFRDIDFPKLTMSPSKKAAKGAGYELEWSFSRLVAGYGIGMVMPSRVQPGELAAHMSFSAPISLGLFLVFIYVITLLRKIEVHPINYLFVAAAFFSFNLLFGYTADRLPVEVAFFLSSAVSVGLVTSYLRLVVGPRFALVEAGLAQLLYQVGFSLAHFFDGYTGLSITVLVILTLFLLMQLTGRLSWSTVFARA
jgi:inner membrane protein involved in colicin E2 resistance